MNGFFLGANLTNVESLPDKPVLRLVESYKPTPEDEALESKLRVCMSQYNNARTPVQKRRYWAKYRSLHSQRSAEFVAWLELAKGLYRP